MNKKFSTLVAGLALVSAVASAQIAPTGNSRYAMLKTLNNEYLAVYGGKADSVVVKKFSDLTDAPKAAIDSAMWRITSAGVDASGNPLYQFTNKKTGALLSFAAAADAKPNLAAGVDTWAVDNGEIYAFYATNRSLTLNVTSGRLSLDHSITSSHAPGIAFFSETDNPVLQARTLEADELGDGFTVFSLNFGEAYQENIFEGKELVATQLTDADDGYVMLQEVGNEMVGDKPLYFGLDTTLYTIAGQENVFGYKFVQDSTYKATTDGIKHHTVGNDNFQKFKFVQNLYTDAVSVYVSAAPVYDKTSKTYSEYNSGADVQVVYAQVTNSKVLTVSGFTINGIEQGVAPSVTLSKGTPATLPTGDGVYYIKVKSDDEFKYIYATTSGLELRKDAPKAYDPAGQFYVVLKDGKYQFVERNYNWGLTTAAAQIYKVTGKEAYRVDNVNRAASASLMDGTEFYFEYQENIPAGGKDYHYLATKYLTKEEIANNAYTLNLISGTEGVENLYTVLANGVLNIESTTADAATKFKVEEFSAGKVWASSSDVHKKGVGAIALGDTLATATYRLYQQYTDNYVYVDDADKALKLADDENPATFTFKTNPVTGKGYLMQTSSLPVSYTVILDVNTGKLNAVNATAVNNNYFDLIVEPAPDYATLNAPGHMLISSAEDDGKGLSMNPTTLLAEVKLAGQEQYIDSLFGLWIDTACVVDVTRPTYYITTQNGLDSTEIAEGYRYYLVQPTDSVFSAVLNATETAYEDVTNEESAYWNADEAAIKAAFVKAITYGDDSLAIVRENPTAVDTLKDMSVNPAAMAFVTTANNTLKIENVTTKEVADNTTDPTEPTTTRETVTSYLKVINNVLVWTNRDDQAHEFVVKATTLSPTANEEVADEVAGVSVIAGNGAVTIQGAAGKTVVITNILGKAVANTVLTSDNQTINVPAGIVAVAVEGEEAVKAIVR